MKTTVIHHSADFDGLFCREIARKFLPDAALIGWDFADVPLNIGHVHDSEQIYVMDLPIDRVFGDDFSKNPPGEKFGPADFSKFVWIDHHKTAIACHPTTIPGYRIDGVAACRLAWQWFRHWVPDLNKGQGGINTFWERPDKQMFFDRKLEEPLAVRLAGEYDIWDKRDPNAELFQYGLRSAELTDRIWQELLNPKMWPNVGIQHSENQVKILLEGGRALKYAKTKENESIIKQAGFDVQLEGLKFLACNHARFNSSLFTAGVKPEHDGVLGFCWKAGRWSVSLYHAPGKEQHDLSAIANKFGGGGHKGACGFQCKTLPFALA